MRSHIKKIYWITLLFAVLMIAVVDVHERVEEFSPRLKEEYSVLTDYDVTTVEEEDAPVGVMQEYSWTLQDVPEFEGSIVIYTVHQEVEVYLGTQLVYSIQPGQDNYFSGAVGCSWAKVHVNKLDEGKRVRVLIRPLYKNGLSNQPMIYYGSYGAICTAMIMNGVPILAMGAVAILVGLAFIVFVMVNRKNSEIDASLSMLGVFSIFAGLWKICDVPTTPLIFGHPQALSAIALISIPIMLVSYMFFVRNQFAGSDYKSWDIACLLCTLCCGAVILLQMTGLADLRQTLIMSHIMILGAIVFLMAMIYREMRQEELSGKLKTTVICCVICLLGTGIDLIAYYLSNETGSMIYGMLAFLVYILIMGYYSLKETLSLIDRGKEAKKFEQMATHDQLTGLYNRAYFAQYIKNYNVQQRDCYIVTFDVNNLKQCNDNFGHDCGDRLLKNSAELMKKAFLEKGDCIRMGGDEFTVIMRHIGQDEVQECLRTFQELTDQFNAEHPDEFPVHIAFGTAFYDDAVDYDFSDTMRRADKKMYQMKMSMKTARA